MRFKTSCFAVLAITTFDATNAASPYFERNCAVGDEQQGCIMYELSMIELIANPGEYDWGVVRIRGYAVFDKVRYEESGDSIYVSKEAADHGFLKDGLWLDVSNSSPEIQSRRIDGYVLLEGTFSASNQGHFGQWSGSIARVTRFDILE